MRLHELNQTTLALHKLRDKHKQVCTVPGSGAELRELLLLYYKQHKLPADLSHVGNCLWQGVYSNSDGKLLSVVGLQEMTSNGKYLLFIVDWCKRPGPAGSRAFGQLAQFLEEVPFPLRGLVLAHNSAMRRMLTNRNRVAGSRRWDDLAVLVESDPIV